MFTKFSNGNNSKYGSIILEMAIAVPTFIVISTIILISINCRNADIAFSQAVDQVSGEIAVSIPVIGAGIDVITKISGMVTTGSDSDESNIEDSYKDGALNAVGIAAAVSNYFGIDGADILGTLLFGQMIRDRIVEAYNEFSENDIIKDIIRNVSVAVDYDAENRVIWIRTYYQWVTPFGTYDKSIQSSAPIYGNLEIELNENSTNEQADEIWMESNFVRGDYLREHFGGNLPHSFPVISSWNNGTATSIKSVDLTAPTYSEKEALFDKISEHIEDLSEFHGTDQPWGKDQITIEESEITNRILIIVIPSNSEDTIVSQLESYEDYASSQGVVLQIEKYGNSYKYEEKEDNTEANLSESAQAA